MNKKIIALTTDPYGNIHGYSLVFIRLFNFIQKNNPDLTVTLISNDGVCSKIVNNKKFLKIKLNPKSNLLFKTIFLAFLFIKNVWHCDKGSVLISNTEIPELLAAFFLKIKFKHGNIYCIVHDNHVRDKLLKTKMINKLRNFLIKRVNNAIFVNRYTMKQLDSSINKFYIGNPIF